MQILSFNQAESIQLPYFQFNSPIQREIKKIDTIVEQEAVGIGLEYYPKVLQQYMWLVIVHNYFSKLNLQNPPKWKQIISNTIANHKTELEKYYTSNPYTRMFFSDFFPFMIKDNPELEKPIVQLIVIETGIVELVN